MPSNVYVTRKIPEAGLDLLRAECNVEINPNNRVLSREELLVAVRGRNGILTQLNDAINAEVMDAAGKQLKVISNYAVGYNNIDLDAAKKRNIVVTNTPEVLTESCADFTWALMMAIARRIPEADRFTRDKKFEGWDPLLLLGADVHGKTLGIVGFGRIGQAVAKRAAGFNMKILAPASFPRNWEFRSLDSPRGKQNPENVTFVKFEELLQQSDFVSIHTPLTPETRHLIGEKELRMMKPTSYLINTSRGPVVDEKALARALKERWIAGAALDVYEEEPKIVPELFNLSNIILAPHISSATLETRTNIGIIAAKNLLAVLEGRNPLHLVA